MDLRSRLGFLVLLPIFMAGAGGCDVPTDDVSDAGGDARDDVSEMDAPAGGPDLVPEAAPEVPSAPVARLRVVFTSARSTSERGTQATFTVAFDGDPAADVTFALSSSNVNEGTVSPASLTFTPANARAPQTVTVTGVDDASKDGDAAFQIVFGPAASLDPNFAGISAAPIEMVNLDDEHAGFAVLQAGPLSTSEAGKQAQFAIVATGKPTANVTLPVASADPSEGTVSPASLVFTPDNWDAPQLITVTGVDDSDTDGTQQFGVVLGPSTSSDSAYVGLQPTGPTVSNADDESPGVVVTGANLRTNEGGGQATFTVALQSRPTGDVTIPVSSGDASEGQVAPVSLTFTSVSWNAPQTVTATGVDDALADGNQLYAVVLGRVQSTDPAYAAIDPADVMVTNVDNDSAGVTVSAASAVQTSEAGATAQVSLVLNSQPTGDVSFAVTSSDVAEGTVAPATLTFTATDWNVPHVVTVTGVDDAVADGNQVYAIVFAPAASSDSNYAGLDPGDMPAQNVDNDSAGIMVTAGSLVTTEVGGTATFTVVLSSQPTANVTLGLSSSDTTEGTVAPAALVFTAANWSTPQVVTVTGVSDNLNDGNQSYSVITAPAATSDSSYAGFDAADVVVSNTDNPAGVVIARKLGIATSERGAAVTFDVVLTRAPAAPVHVPFSSSDLGEAQVGASELVFGADSWNVPQTLTVVGVDDQLEDGPQPFTLVLGQLTSNDPGYAGVNPPDVDLRNLDNDHTSIAAKQLIANHNCRLLSQDHQRVAIDESGNIYAAVHCGERNVAPDPWGDPLLPPLIMTSRDGGQTFGPPVAVPGISRFIDFRAGAPGEAFAIGVTPSKKITFIRTEDAGVTWSPAIELFAAQWATLAVAGKHVVIADLLGQETLLVSHDGGRNFTRIEGVNRGAYAYLSVKPDGTIWGYSRYASTDSIHGRSTDDGKTFVHFPHPFPTYDLDLNWPRAGAFGADLLVTQGWAPGAGYRTLVVPLGSAPAFTLPGKSSIGPLIRADDTNTFIVIPNELPRKVFWSSLNETDFVEGPGFPVGHGEVSVAFLSDSALAIAYVTQDGFYFTVVRRP